MLPRVRSSLYASIVRFPAVLSITACCLLLALLPAASVAQTVTTTVAAGSSPSAVAVNPITNKIYIANHVSNNVTVIDGATNTTTKVSAGSQPSALAVNPLTNKIYVANYGSANVTVIDGATNTTTTVAAGTNPDAIALDPVTNNIYVANYGSANVTAINGANNTTTTVAAGTNPYAVAVNPSTNQVYVANYGSANVTAINEANNQPTTVAAGTNPCAVAVNPVTNLIYVANYGSAGSASTVTVINGANNTVTATVAAGTNPDAIAVNPVTDTIYVANYGTLGSASNVTVINGASNTAFSPITVGMQPNAIAVDPITNQIYVANYGGGSASTVTVINGATGGTTALTAGSAPWAVALNPVTNKVYVANHGSNNVTVIDGATNATATVLAQSGSYTQPDVVAVNPVTNKIYVANEYGYVTVIDGATNATATVLVGTWPTGLAVNPITNKTYVANCGSACTGRTSDGSGSVTIIDGATNAATTLAVGTNPSAVAVNPVTNQIYITNQGSNNVTVMDGTTDANSMVEVTNPVGVAVNPVTNKIYVVSGNNTVTVIDGSTLATTTLAATVWNGGALAVNPVTNKIYISTYAYGTILVMDGVTNSMTQVAAGVPCAVAVNPVTNKIYALNCGSGVVTVIDGSTLATTNVSTPAGATMTVNPVTNKIYVGGNNYGDFLTMIDGATLATSTFDIGNHLSSSAMNLVTDTIYVADGWDGKVVVLTEASNAAQASNVVIQPLEGNTSSAFPSFQLAAQDMYDNPLQPAAVYWQLDTWQGPWLPAVAGSGVGNFSATPTMPLAAGTHVLYAYPVQGDVGDPALDLGSPRIGNIAAYPFVVSSYNQLWLEADVNTQTYGQPVTFTATVIPHPANTQSITGTVTFYDGINFLGTVAVTSGGSASLTTSMLVAGQHNISASYSGDSNYYASSGNVNGAITITPATLTVTANSLSMIYGGTPPTLTYTMTGFANGDTQESATSGSPNLSTAATWGSTVASYLITVTAGSLSSANYTFSYVNGTLTVTKATPTLTWGTPAPITYGTALSSTQLNASSTVAGTYAYSPAAGTVLNAGSQALSVTFSPTDTTDYTTATDSTSLTVNQAIQTIAFPNPGAQTYGVAPITLTATATSGLPVSYTVTSGPATVSGSVLTITGAGSVTVQASQAGNSNYSAAAPVSVTFTVNQATQTITFPNPGAQTYGVAPITLTATATSSLSVSYTVTSGPATVSGSVLTITGVGSVTVQASQAGNANYSAATPVSVTFTVNQAMQTITFPNPGAQTYGVAPITLTATATSGLPVSYTVISGPATVSGSVLTITGVGSVTVQASQAGNANYSAAAPVSVTFTVNQWTTAPGALLFVPMTPCRLVDTRNATGPFGGPSIAGETSRSYVIPNSTCGVPSTVAAYSLNVTVVPHAGLGYLTVWPTGVAQPLVSILNSDGRVKANAAIVPAGTSGAISVYATDTTDVVLDINGYFVPATDTSALAFYPLTPCRVADTRNASGALGGPSLVGMQSRAFPILSSACNIPSSAQAYSLNFTAVPQDGLGYLSAWPTGQTWPGVSTLNVSPNNPVVANAAIVPAGTSGEINVLGSNNTDVVIDINGYFAPVGSAAGSQALFTVTPCRVLDTRSSSGLMNGTLPVNVTSSSCGIPSSAEAFVLNATVVPTLGLGYLTLWPENEAQPVVSTLNADDGVIASNMAIVPTTNGSIDAFSSSSTQLILDISGYFAPSSTH